MTSPIFFHYAKDCSWVLEAGVRISSQTEVLVDWKTNEEDRKWLQEAGKHKKDFRTLSPEVIRDGFERVLLSENPSRGLDWLMATGMLEAWLPEVAAMAKFDEQSGGLHKDVWEHTKQVVAQAANRPLVRWAALFHDIGKVPTRTFTKTGEVHFYGHAEIGAKMFLAVGERMQFTPSIKEGLSSLILNHLRPNQYLESWTDSAIRRFIKETEPYLEDLLDLSRADVTSERPGRRQEVLVSVDMLAERIRLIKEADTKEPLLPPGIGDEMIRQLGISPSPLLGSLKKALEAAVSSGELEERRELDYYLSYAKSLLANKTNGNL